MTEKELKKLRRADLLELLLQQSRENQQLRQQLDEARAQLDARTIRIANAGSLAEAAMALSGVFEAAQDACALYLDNIHLRSREADAYRQTLLDALQQRCGECPKWQDLSDALPEQTGRDE